MKKAHSSIGHAKYVREQNCMPPIRTVAIMVMQSAKNVHVAHQKRRCKYYHEMLVSIQYTSAARTVHMTIICLLMTKQVSTTIALYARSLFTKPSLMNAPNVTIGFISPASMGKKSNMVAKMQQKCEQAAHSHIQTAHEYAHRVTMVGKAQMKEYGDTPIATPSAQRDADLRGQADYYPLPKPI